MILPEQYMLLYDAIINGDFQPCSERFHNPEVLKSIVIEANTIIVKKLKPGESEKFIQDTDYTCYGYKSCNDFKVMIRDSTEGHKEIILYPLKTYKHSERIDIPHVNSFKCNCFFMLLADEYERIKIRVEKFMHKNRKRKELEIYAVNKIQKAKMLFDEARHRLCSASNGYDAEDALIIFTLCLYLIHIILFIQRHFAHFLQNNSFTEETLKSELLKCYGFREVTSLIYIIWSSNGAVQKKSFHSTRGIHDETIAQRYNRQDNDNNPKKSFIAAQGFERGGKIDNCTELNGEYEENDNQKKSCIEPRELHKGTSYEAQIVQRTDNSKYNLLPEESIIEQTGNNEHEAGMQKTFFNDHKSKTQRVLPQFEKIKCNCQVNVLFDLFLQLAEKIMVSGKPFFETSIQNMASFLQANFLDKNGKELSPYTLNTLSKDYRDDKRLHPESPKRIDVSKLTKSKSTSVKKAK